MGNQAAEALARGSDQYVNDLMGRASAQNPDWLSIGKSIEDRMGGDHIQYAAHLSTGNDAARRKLMEDAYIKGGSKPVAGFYNMMAGTDAMSRAGQAGVYGAIGGGVTLGLTAAGQGVLALMGYLQQGERSQEQREQPLV